MIRTTLCWILLHCSEQCKISISYIFRSNFVEFSKVHSSLIYPQLVKPFSQVKPHKLHISTPPTRSYYCENSPGLNNLNGSKPHDAPLFWCLNHKSNFLSVFLACVVALVKWISCSWHFNSGIQIKISHSFFQLCYIYPPTLCGFPRLMPRNKLLAG